MQKRTKIIIASVLTLGISGAVFGFGAHHHFSHMSLHEKSEMISDRISRKLDLDELQRDNLERFTAHMATVMQQLREDQSMRDQLIETVISDQPVDQAAILGKIQQKTELLNQQAPETVALLASFMDSLSNEQKQTMKKMIEKRRGHRWGHHQQHEPVHYEQ